MGERGQALNRIYGAEGVREVHHRNEPGSVAEQPLEFVQVELAGSIDGNHSQRGPGLPANQLPWDDVRVVLHAGYEDLIAGLEDRSGVALSDEVDALSGTPG